MQHSGKDDFIKSKYMDFYLFAGYKNDYIHKAYAKQSGTFDPVLSEWLIKNVKPGWIIYDVGANMFEVTEIGARLAGSTGVVRSFEPQIDLVNKYLLAQKLNRYDGVAEIQINTFGLGIENKNTTFMINKDNLGGSTFNRSFKDFADSFLKIQWEMSECEIKRFDSLPYINEVPDLVKVDIEGGEEDFWNGSSQNLKNAKHIIMEMGKYTSKDFFEEVLFGRYAYDINTMNAIDFSTISASNKQWNVLFMSKDNNGTQII